MKVKWEMNVTSHKSQATALGRGASPPNSQWATAMGVAVGQSTRPAGICPTSRLRNPFDKHSLLLLLLLISSCVQMPSAAIFTLKQFARGPW
jgi:hypothetical protein